MDHCVKNMFAAIFSPNDHRRNYAQDLSCAFAGQGSPSIPVQSLLSFGRKASQIAQPRSGLHRKPINPGKMAEYEAVQHPYMQEVLLKLASVQGRGQSENKNRTAGGVGYKSTQRECGNYFTSHAQRPWSLSGNHHQEPDRPVRLHHQATPAVRQVGNTDWQSYKVARADLVADDEAELAQIVASASNPRIQGLVKIDVDGLLPKKRKQHQDPRAWKRHCSAGTENMGVSVREFTHRRRTNPSFTYR